MAKVLTAKDVSGILRIGINQAYALMKSKTFPSYQIGNRLYVTEAALDDWLKKIEHKTIVM